MKLRSHSEKAQNMISSVSIQSLPEEVLLQIFSHLTLGELCNTVAKVCTQWRRLHWDPHLYPLPSALDRPRDTREILSFFNNARYLASPYFKEEYILETIMKVIVIGNMAKCTQTGLITFDTRFYKELIIMLAHLRKVNLKAMPLHTMNRDSLPHLSRYCIQVEELSLLNTEYFIAGVVSKNAGLLAMFEQVRGTLRVLHLGGVPWCLESIIAISKCDHLEDLAMGYLISLNSTNKKASQCLGAISSMSSLRRLRFKSCSLENNNAWIVIFSNDSLKDLTSLDLQNCNFNDQLAVAIGANLKNLTELYLEPKTLKNCVAREGLAAIIMGCNKLTRLEVQCGGQHSIVPTIMLIPKYLPGLKELAVVCPQLDTIDWQTPLKIEMPGLVIRGKFSEPRSLRRVLPLPPT